LSEVLRQLDLVTQARRDRLVTAAGTVPGVVWLVLFAGAVLTISFTFFFGTQNVLVQTLMTGMLSLLIFAGLFVIVAIHRPFAGSVKVQPEALQAVLEEFSHVKQP
jgi:high-affinity Fe2+/Pb2+ permease